VELGSPSNTLTEPLSLSRKQIVSIVEAEHARTSIWEGSVRSGKTLASLFAFLAAVAEAPPSGIILIVGRTLQTIERNIIAPLTDAGLFGSLANHVVHTRGATTATILGREVHLIGASDARAEGKLRGMTAYLVMVDEATLIPEEFWTQLLARLSVPGARLLATTNPGAPAHWLRKKFLLRAGELNLATWHFTLDDNPALDPAFVAALKVEFTGLWYRRYVQGEWCIAEGSIYDTWDDTIDVIAPENLPKIARVISVGIDYGTTNATRGVLLGISDELRPRLVALDEWAPPRLTDAELSASFRAWLGTRRPEWRNPEWIVVDPAAASFKLQLFRDGLGNVMNGANEVVPGIQTIASLLATRSLVVSSDCPELIAEIPAYAWDPKATLRGEDKPIKADDHSVDGLRYGVHSTRALWQNAIQLTSTPMGEAA